MEGPPLLPSLLQLRCHSEYVVEIEYLLDKVIHLKGNCVQMLARCSQCCTCGSDLVILVQTEVWSSLTKHSWLIKEAFALCDCMDLSCAVFFSSSVFLRPAILL